MDLGLQKWEKIGRIIAPDPNISWMSTYAGPSFALQIGSSPIFDIYITGRDSKNRSQIGRARIDIRDPKRILELDKQPVFSCGTLGAFDENGVSYPYLLKKEQEVYMYYVGWMPTVLTPFNLQLGLAVQSKNGSFKRVSRAPILARNDDDFLSIGSCCVLMDDGLWKMWYTSFLKWGATEKEHKHDYIIKYATSKDGQNWRRDNQICIPIQHPDEYSICRPTVYLDAEKKYHMWYAYRGEQYKIGYAHSSDGIHWTRRDDLTGITTSSSGWDGESVTYPHVFPYQNSLYMLYNGNQYGKEGLGLARLAVSAL